MKISTRVKQNIKKVLVRCKRLERYSAPFQVRTSHLLRSTQNASQVRTGHLPGPHMSARVYMLGSLGVLMPDASALPRRTNHSLPPRSNMVYPAAATAPALDAMSPRYMRVF